jgi:CheY-like chemotaxis protein
MSLEDDKVVVLVADDEPSTLALVAAHVRSRGHTVYEASDGDQAWQLAYEHLPDLVVLDVMMPGMSGWEVCRKIREAVSLAHTGVIMLTGIGENLNEMTSPLYGADAYLDKPFEFSDLDARIEEVLARRRGGAMGRADVEQRKSSPPPPVMNGSNGALAQPPLAKAAPKPAKAAPKPKAKAKAKAAAKMEAAKPAKKAVKAPPKKKAPLKAAKTKAKPAKAKAEPAKKAAKAKAAKASKAAVKKPAKKAAAKKPAKAKPAAKTKAKTKGAAKKPSRTEAPKAAPVAKGLAKRAPKRPTDPSASDVT